MPGESSSETGNPYGRMHVTEPVRATIPVQNGAWLSWDPWIESEKINCLHRPCSRLEPRGKIESVRTHSEVIEQFDSFLLLKLLFLVRN